MKEALEAIPETSTLKLLKQAQQNMANTKAVKQMNAITEKWDKLRQTKGNEAANKYLEQARPQYAALEAQHKAEVERERRRLETKPFEDFYKKNAKKYGFIYRFEQK